MHESGADFTNTFRRLASVCEGNDDATLIRQFADTGRFAEWCLHWRARAAREKTTPEVQAQAMRRVNPAFIPRNHRVEAALKQAITSGDLSGLTTLSKVLATPYDDQPEHAEYAEPPPASFGPYRTFCGT